MGVCVSKGKDSKPRNKGHRHAGTVRVVHKHKSHAHAPFVNQSKTPTPHQTYQSSKKVGPPKPVQKSDPILGTPFEDIRKFYNFGKELGRGQYGLTHLCTEKSSGLQYACKSISKRKLVSQGEKEDVKREIQIMQHLSGQPNVVEFKSAYEDSLFVHVVMELCSGGDLYDRINGKGHYTERAAASIC